jgi:peptidoglycan biosynthesis protein MviN/MurJ (putative lipid II flippase)
MADNLITFMRLNLLKTSGSVQACNEIALLYYYYYKRHRHNNNNNISWTSVVIIVVKLRTRESEVRISGEARDVFFLSKV